MNIPARIIQWLRQARERLVDIQSPPARWRFSWVDALVLVLFALCGAVLYLDKIQGPYPYVRFGSDAGNIASFAAARLHPELFLRDPLLSDPANLRSYATINIPILNLLEPLAGNYALAFAWFIPVQVFVNLAGFYLLGLVLFGGLSLPRRRFWAALLAVVLAVPFQMNLLETWGVAGDPVTRFTFQALLPYLLALALLWRDRPARWPWLILAAGLLSFVHPVSTPAWAFAIWLGLLAGLPAAWGFKRRALTMLGLGGLLGMALAPYALTYLSTLGGARAAPLDYDLFVGVIQHYFPVFILDIPAALGEFLQITLAAGLLPVALLLGGALAWLHWRDRARLNQVLLWFAGLLVVSLLVPWVEHIIEQALRIPPLETELVRGLRYVVFFMLLISVWCLAEFDRRLAGSRWRMVPGLLALALLAGWLQVADMHSVIPYRLAGCLSQGQWVCVQANDDSRAIQAMRQYTPPGATIFTTFAANGRMAYSMPVRYLAGRALVFAFKDRGQLVTAHSPAVGEWFARLQAMNKADAIPSPPARMAAYLALARAWGADYVLADFNPGPLPNAEPVYGNSTYLLLKLR